MPKALLQRPRLLRTRTLTFRVTDEEFDRLQGAATLSGATCLSDFVRQSALNSQGHHAEPQAHGSSPLAQQLQNLQERMRQVELQMSEIYTSSPRRWAKTAGE